MSGGYYQEQHSYNHSQQYQQDSSYYPSDRKVAPLDDGPYSPQHSEPVYPPIPLNFNTSNTASAPYMIHPTSTENSTQIKPFSSSSIDLETATTDEGVADASVYPSYTEPKKDNETGIKAALYPNSLACRVYLLVVLVETIIDLAIEASILLRLNDMADSTSSSLTSNGPATTQTRQPVYLGLFALAHVLQMYLAVESVYNKNTLQFLFLAIFNFSLLVYGGLQIYEVKENVDQYIKPGVSSAHSTQITALTIAVPCVIGIAEIAYIALGWKIWKEFGWKVYKFLGADRNIKRMYAQYQVFECLLKFDIFFYVGFSIQWLSLVLTDKDFEFWATVVALPVSLLLLVEGLLAARHENKWMMGSFMFGCVAGCAYFVYKAFRVYSNRKDADFLHLYKSLLIFACLSIILLCTTFISATIVMLNFGKGLKQSMNRKNDVHKLERRGTEYKGGLRPGGYNPKRMSIE